jgi:hypothetical protein
MSAVPRIVRPPADTGPDAAPTDGEMVAWLRAILEPGQVVELRAPKCQTTRAPKTENVIRRFRADDQGIRAMVEAARKLTGNAPGVYFTLNPVDPAMLDPARDGTGATDADILRRRWLLIDPDPKRNGTDSATDEEKAKGLARTLAVRDYLRSEGWPGVILCDSGNSGHLLCRIDLPADDIFKPGTDGRPVKTDGPSSVLLKRCLLALAARFDDDAVQIDTKVYNASRIDKLYGTWARKGKATKDRPHRVSRIVELPEDLAVVPPELLEALADSVHMRAPATMANGNGHHPARTNGDGRWSNEARALAWLAKCEPAVSGQRGHDKLLWAASVGPKFDLTEQQTRDLLARHYNPRCQPEWSDREIDHKVREAFKLTDRRGELLEKDRADYGGLAAGDDSQADAPVGQPAPSATFSNFRWKRKDGGEDAVKEPLRVEDLARSLEAICPGWPKRVDDRLFWETPRHEPLYLDSSARLFAWIDARAQVDWTKGVGKFIPQERFYEHLRMTAEPFGSIEVLPHHPPMPGAYYMLPQLPPAGRRLRRFLGFFCPETPEDAELILAMILTPLWGGPAGRRPAFLVTGPDDDPKQGRGTGKTTLVDVLADEVLNGFVDVSPTDQIADVKTRLLSDAGRQIRIARLDNVKTLKFSWADLEGLITSPEISGKQLYQGEGRRPNTLAWLITLNGASLSADMAQRVVVIKLRRPDYRAEWEEEVRAFAREHRWGIIADAVELLRTPTPPAPTRTRWGAWEREVLSKTAMPDRCLKLIAERQETVDDDNAERDLVADHFARKLEEHGHRPAEACVLIPSQVAAEWLSEVMRKTFATNHATAHLGGLSIAELRRSRTKDLRGWIWTGPEARQGVEPVKLRPMRF